MKFLDSLLGRTKPKPANLDALFALPTAAVTLEAAHELRSSGFAAVCLKPASGQNFTTARLEFEELLAATGKDSGTFIRQQQDNYGYLWVLFSDPELEDLVGTVHLVNATLEERGFGSQLLCSVFAFAGPVTDLVYLVYLYKRGTFYPFAPRGDQRRDNELELEVRGTLGSDLPVETDLNRWFPLWGIPTP